MTMNMIAQIHIGSIQLDEAGVEATESTSILNCAADGLATTFLDVNSAS